MPFDPNFQIPEVLLPKALKTKFTLNEEYFQTFSNTLRTHQKEALESIQNTHIAQINIPTGTGKTYIQKHIHTQDMIAKTKNNETGIYVIAAHRLALCTQLFNEILDLVIPCGIKANMIYIGSERYNFDAINKKYRHLGFAIENIEGEQTTSSFIVKQKVEDSKKQNRHTIIVSTYHSFNRLSKLDKIDIVTFDEAHTTTSTQFTENIKEVKPIMGKQYYFTATRKVDGDDGGQNNEEFYGKVTYEMNPRKAIELGEIVRPRFHFIRCSDLKGVDIQSNKTMMVKTVIEAFKEHKKKLNELAVLRNVELNESLNPIGPKILITVNGLYELHSIHNDPTFQNFCIDNKIKVFAFSSDEGEYYNFKTITRQNALDKMNEMELEESAIMFHYDILTEGIDLPAITGVLLLRDLPTAKLLQNVGRGARLLKDDRKKLYNKEVLPHECLKLRKPFCWIILPEYLTTLEGGERIKKMIVALRETYDIPFETLGQTDQALALQEHHLPSVTQKDQSGKRDKQKDLSHIFENIRIMELVTEITNAENPEQALLDKIMTIQV